MSDSNKDDKNKVPDTRKGKSSATGGTKALYIGAFAVVAVFFVLLWVFIIKKRSGWDNAYYNQVFSGTRKIAGLDKNDHVVDGKLVPGVYEQDGSYKWIAVRFVLWGFFYYFIGGLVAFVLICIFNSNYKYRSVKDDDKQVGSTKNDTFEFPGWDMFGWPGILVKMFDPGDLFDALKDAMKTPGKCDSYKDNAHLQKLNGSTCGPTCPPGTQRWPLTKRGDIPIATECDYCQDGYRAIHKVNPTTGKKEAGCVECDNNTYRHSIPNLSALSTDDKLTKYKPLDKIATNGSWDNGVAIYRQTQCVTSKQLQYQTDKGRANNCLLTDVLAGSKPADSWAHPEVNPNKPITGDSMTCETGGHKPYDPSRKFTCIGTFKDNYYVWDPEPLLDTLAEGNKLGCVPAAEAIKGQAPAKTCAEHGWGKTQNCSTAEGWQPGDYNVMTGNTAKQCCKPITCDVWHNKANYKCTSGTYNKIPLKPAVQGDKGPQQRCCKINTTTCDYWNKQGNPGCGIHMKLNPAKKNRSKPTPSPSSCCLPISCKKANDNKASCGNGKNYNPGKQSIEISSPEGYISNCCINTSPVPTTTCGKLHTTDKVTCPGSNRVYDTDKDTEEATKGNFNTNCCKPKPVGPGDKKKCSDLQSDNTCKNKNRVYDSGKDRVDATKDNFDTKCCKPKPVDPNPGQQKCSELNTAKTPCGVFARSYDSKTAGNDANKNTFNKNCCKDVPKTCSQIVSGLKKTCPANYKPISTTNNNSFNVSEFKSQCCKLKRTVPQVCQQLHTHGAQCKGKNRVYNPTQKLQPADKNSYDGLCCTEGFANMGVEGFTNDGGAFKRIYAPF